MHGDSNARGVCILTTQKVNIKQKDYWNDTNGRVQILSFTLNEDEITLVNIYAPNIDSPCFFVQLFEKLTDFPENKILMGDFNLTLNSAIDRKNSHHNNEKASQLLQQAMEEFFLVDIWRNRNPDVRQYSYS